MTALVDTSVLYALLDAGDAHHARAAAAYRAALERGDDLVTTSYVVVEASALVQRRLGMAALRALHEDILPTVRVHWIDESEHAAAVEAVLVAGRRDLSLVDCVSFGVMRRRGIRRALAIDDDFAAQGFDVL